MCEDMQMSYNTVSSWFKRRSGNIDVKIMKQIAQYLDTTLEYLIDGNEQYKYANDCEYYNHNTIIVVKDKDTKKYYKFNDKDFYAVVTIIEKFTKE